ncbi:MobF family relaxase, partial [Teredinibacter turnerae]|uniref:MobF family relaxase n=1 Tax=Teredinibacter turnerae TaxID=2426 RepID=UPI00037118CA
MMTPAPIKSAGHAAKYFEETDDYYREGGKALSQWYGKGAEELGLKGKVDGQDLRDVLQGRLPNDIELGRSVTNKETGEIEWKHRPGVDAQFAPPKTVSIAALVGGDDRLVEAHNRAVQTALKHYEDNFLSTRIRAGDGVVTREMTGKLVAATMLHETSRAQEPQLHTHSLIMNATQSQDGKWRSIDDRTVFVAQKTLGMVYKQALSHDAARLGYDVIKTSNQGDFDIKGIPKEIVNSFSSRSVQIEAALADRGKDRESASSAEKRVLAIDTRLAKSYANHDELKKDWHKSALEKGFDAKAFVKDAEDRSQRTGFQETLKVDTASHADSAVKFAAEKLAERSAVFSERKLLEEATKEGMGKASIDDIRAAVARATHLIPKDTKEYNPVSKSLEPTGGYTTQKGQDIESRLLKAELQGRNQSDRIMPESEAKQYQQTVESRSQYTWTSSQRNATVSLLTNSDNVVGIQGYAGTAKTTSVLAAYKDALEERGYKVMGLAPTGSTAATLRESGGFNGAQTVSSHLLKQEAKEREEAKSSNDRSQKQPDDKAVDKWKASQQLVDGTAGFVGRGGAYYTRDLDGRWQKAD